MPHFRWWPRSLHLKISGDKRSGVPRRPHCSWHPHCQHGYKTLSTSCEQDIQATPKTFLLYKYWHQFPGLPRHLSQRVIRNGSMGSTKESPLKTLYKPLSSTTDWSRMLTPRYWQLSLLYTRGRCSKESNMFHRGGAGGVSPNISMCNHLISLFSRNSYVVLNHGRGVPPINAIMVKHLVKSQSKRLDSKKIL